jgi:hypothetical protein
MSPNSLDPRSPRDYRRRASVIVAYGLSGMVIGATGLIDPDLLGTSSIGSALSGPLPEVWLATYAFGGFLAFFGVLALRPEVETVGLYLLVAAALINATAIFAIRGPIAGGVTSTGILLAAWVMHRRIGDLHSAARTDRRETDTHLHSRERRRGPA